MARDTDYFGHNNPMHLQGAVWDGHRSIRFASGEGLATVAYSYVLSHHEMLEAAERITLALNLIKGLTNDEVRRAGVFLRKDAANA